MTRLKKIADRALRPTFMSYPVRAWEELSASVPFGRSPGQSALADIREMNEAIRNREELTAMVWWPVPTYVTVYRIPRDIWKQMGHHDRAKGRWAYLPDPERPPVVAIVNAALSNLGEKLNVRPKRPRKPT